MASTIDQLMQRVREGRDLSREEMANLFAEIMAGHLAPDAVESFLRELSAKGETVDEIVGAAEVMRRNVTPIACAAPNAIDTCGTGGDGISTFNVSTAAALVAAGAGAVVAKHGNRSNSRASGSAEVLAELGVNIDAPPKVVERCLREIGIGFLFAAKLHPAMASVVAIRRRLGKPTIFNLLGPLTNPAGVKRQIIGVPRADLMDKVAAALARLGAVRAFVIHGRDGLCDLTITTESICAEVCNGAIARRTIQPEDAGLSRAALDALRVKSPAESANVIREILDGQHGPARDHTLLNAALALVAADRASDLKDGADCAAASIDTGAARTVLKKLIEISGADA